MRVLWLLHELGLAFEVRTWPLDKSLRSEEFLALNPAGRVPALELDGARLFESGAMIELLCERFPEAGLGCMPGDRDRAQWLTWVHFSETISQHSAALTQQHVALREDHLRSPIVMKLEAARLGKCYGAIEQALAGQDYLLPSGFSAADIAVGQACYMALHFARMTDYPATARWYRRITAREAFSACLPLTGDRIYAQDFYEAWAP